MRPKSPPRACLYCEKLACKRGMCNAHYLRWIRYNGRIARQRRPKGQGTYNKDGYHLITVNGRQVLEHRQVVADHLGRPLTRAEIVHHIDEVTFHNVIDNLELVTRATHCRIHAPHRHKH